MGKRGETPYRWLRARPWAEGPGADPRTTSRRTWLVMALLSPSPDPRASGLRGEDAAPQTLNTGLLPRPSLSARGLVSSLLQATLRSQTPVQVHLRSGIFGIVCFHPVIKPSFCCYSSLGRHHSTKQQTL